MSSHTRRPVCPWTSPARGLDGSQGEMGAPGAERGARFNPHSAQAAAGGSTAPATLREDGSPPEGPATGVPMPREAMSRSRGSGPRRRRVASPGRAGPGSGQPNLRRNSWLHPPGPAPADRELDSTPGWHVPDGAAPFNRPYPERS